MPQLPTKQLGILIAIVVGLLAQHFGIPWWEATVLVFLIALGIFANID
jgi:hypothetical protein